jgi:sortase A
VAHRRKQVASARAITGLGIVLLIAGIATVMYPPVREWMYEREVAALKEEFIRQTGKPANEDTTNRFDELYQMLQKENEQLHETGQDGLRDAFSYQQPAIDLSEYGIMDNRIGFIMLPAIGMELPIYLGANDANMSKGAVHLTQTSYPIGGVNTNSVIAAHRGTNLVMFLNIHRMVVGDEVIITNFREELIYRTVEIKIINPSDTDEILIQKDKDMVTLITCNPINGNYQRYVVYCERVGA